MATQIPIDIKEENTQKTERDRWMGEQDKQRDGERENNTSEKIKFAERD